MNKMRITKHFIERFNLRYLGKNEDWKIKELKAYMKKVFKDYQLRHLERRKDLENAQYIHFGNHHYLVVKNNTFVTILNRKGI